MGCLGTLYFSIIQLVFAETSTWSLQYPSEEVHKKTSLIAFKSSPQFAPKNALFIQIWSLPLLPTLCSE